MGLLVAHVLESHESVEAVRKPQAVEVLEKPLPVGARDHAEPQFPFRQGVKRAQGIREQSHRVAAFPVLRSPDSAGLVPARLGDPELPVGLVPVGPVGGLVAGFVHTDSEMPEDREGGVAGGGEAVRQGAVPVEEDSGDGGHATGSGGEPTPRRNRSASLPDG